MRAMGKWWWALVVLAGLVGAVVWGLRTPARSADLSPMTRPVEVRQVATIEAEAPSGSTVVLMGRVVDAAGQEIPLGQVVIESERGTMRFDSPFVFSCPAMRMITMRGWAWKGLVRA